MMISGSSLESGTAASTTGAARLVPTGAPDLVSAVALVPGLRLAVAVVSGFELAVVFVSPGGEAGAGVVWEKADEAASRAAAASSPGLGGSCRIEAESIGKEK